MRTIIKLCTGFLICLICLCRVCPAQQDSTTQNLLRNGDFEAGFDTSGVAKAWQAFGQGITCKPNPRLGRIGGGIYGTEFKPSGHGDVNSDYQTMRLHGKVNLIDASRFDVVSKLKKQLGPETITIAKLGAEPFFGGAKEALVPDPYKNGQKFADHCYQKSKETNHWARAYYGLNEGNVNDAVDMAKIARFELGFAEKLHTYGLKAVVLNNSVGTPSDMNNMLLPEVRQLLAVADYLGYHCYGGPKGELMCHPDSLEWFSLRWRKVKKMYDDRGWRLPPVIYTEGTTWGGWHGSIKPQAIRDDLIEFHKYMLQDDWTVGLTVFCTGNWKGQIWSKWNLANYPGWQEGTPHLIVDAIRKLNQQHPVDAYNSVNAQELSFTENATQGGIVQRFRTRIGGRYKLRACFRFEFDRVWPNPLTLSIGFDPTGQTKNSRLVKFGSDLIKQYQWESDAWHQYETSFIARTPNLSLWLKAAKPKNGTAWLYLDDISLQPINE
jgi:hypothetical protein